MSLSINHPIGKVTSTSALSFEVQGGTPAAPRNINLSASSVIMPNVQQPVGQSGALIFDSTTKRMKYYDGTEWISWVPSSEITGPITQEITKIYTELGKKIDSVIYNSNSVPSASISGSTLYITFPTGNNTGTGTPGLFTSLPTGSITYYSLLSGQTPASIREQLGGTAGSQNGRNGTQGAPFITTTGWTFADGNYWLWRGENGDVVTRVPNLNQNAYMKAMSTSGITKTDSVIGSSGSVGGTALSIDNLPPHSFSVTGTTNYTGGHTHSFPLSNDKSGTGRADGANSNRYDGDQTTNAAGDHSHTVSGSTNSLGSGTAHNHSLDNVDVDHFNVAVLYNIAQPSLALNQDIADGRYVLKSGDIMSGTLTIASSAVIRGNDTNLSLWFRNNSNAERATIYHNSSDNTLRLRANGGTEVTISNAGLLTATTLRAATVTSTGALTAVNATVTGTTTAATLNVSGTTKSSVLNVTGASTLNTLAVSGAASTGALTVNGALNVSGQITATGDIWAFSDKKLKENIRPILNASEILSKITGIFGNMIADPDKIEKSMVIAQEVQEVFPQAVSTDENGFLKVNYIALIPLLIAAFNEKSGG